MGHIKTVKERKAEQRRAKLEQVQEQIRSGSLEVRQMTDEERRRYPPQDRKPMRRRVVRP